MATGQRTAPAAEPQLDSLPAKFAHVIDRCLAQDPDDRWQTARDIKSELEWAGKPTATSPPAEHPRRTSPLWPALAVIASLALATVAFVHFREPAPDRRIRFTTILPPEKTSFDFATNLGPVALSPDGRRMVFAATGQDGKSQLWLRPLDSDHAQPLSGTDRAIFPFWSPDSRWVGFFAEGKLKKIDTLGGQPIALADAPDGFGGSWSATGTIVFSAETFAPLQKISADGGNASLAATMDAVAGTVDTFPWFLPDNQHFLFVSWRGAGRLKVRLGSLSSTASTIIGEADSNTVYSQGHLLYLRGNSLVAQPFDPKSLHSTGEAVPLAERMQGLLNLVRKGTFAVSTAGLLAYQSGAEAGMRQLTWFDRTGNRVGTLGEPRPFWDIELSPDRRTLAAAVPDASGTFDLWMYDVARGLPARFTSDPAGAYYARWSPDGRTVIFNSTRRGHYDLYRKPANGTGAEELLYGDDTDKVPTSWSPDGKFLLYFVGSSRKNVWVLPLTPERPGAALKPVPFLQSRFNEVGGRISPDGRWVAYESDEFQRLEIYVAPFSRPSEKHQISLNGGQLARWRRDGKEIFFEAPDGQLMAAEVRISGETMEVGAVRPLSIRIATFHGGYSYDVAADGQRILAAVPLENKPAEPITLVENWTAALKK
jgi:Tol biopolymer transport system component